MTYPKRNKYEHFPNDHNKVVVYEFRNNDKFQGGVEKGFVLEYITVWQPKQGGGRKIVQYAIDENSATDKGIPM